MSRIKIFLVGFNNAIKYADEGVQRMLRFGVPAERAIFWQNVKYMQRLTAVFWICALVTANTMCIYSLIQYLSTSTTTEQPDMILRSWYPAENMDKHFAVLYCIQLYIMYVGQLIVPCWHVFMVSLMVYVRTSLMVLNYKLAHIDEYVASGMRSGRKMQVIKDPIEESFATRRELIIECIQQQRMVYNYTIELEDLIKSAVFMDFVVFSVLLCALLFEASVVRELGIGVANEGVEYI